MKIVPVFACILGWTLGLTLNGCVPPQLFWGFALDGNPLTEARLKALQAETGIHADCIVFFLRWPEPNDSLTGIFPQETLDAIWDQDAVPCLTWEPMVLKEGKEIAVPCRQILEGAYDPFLAAFARAARTWNRPLMIRFAHEMNLQRYHWGTEAGAYGPESPGLYQEMFRYVVTHFRNEGADNVRWVFCPNAESIPNPARDPQATWNQARNYYPGDAWVDILGMDGYNWGTTQTKDRIGWDSRWVSFEQIFQELHAELKELAPTKPILIMETSCVDQDGAQARWGTDLLKTVRSWKVIGVCWFQVNKEQDWRLQKASAALIAGALKPAGGSQAQHWLRSLKHDQN
ncbi:MAG: glycosyl hydrolase [Kiritimatiellota bacterium]|nr:glycosyl hydrolase [Kiritimatiellota bacterium]